MSKEELLLETIKGAVFLIGFMCLWKFDWKLAIGISCLLLAQQWNIYERLD